MQAGETFFNQNVFTETRNPEKTSVENNRTVLVLHGRKRQSQTGMPFQ